MERGGKSSAYVGFVLVTHKPIFLKEEKKPSKHGIKGELMNKKINQKEKEHQHSWICQTVSKELDPLILTHLVEYAYLICPGCGEVKKKRVIL
jgi:hypothetical protein